MLKTTVGFALGAIAGGLGVYIYMKDKVEKQIQEEVEAFKNQYHKKDNSEQEEKEQSADEIVKENKYAPAKVNYSGYSKEKTYDKEEDYYEDDSSDNFVAGSEDTSDEPHVITRSEFVNGKPYHDKETLMYYALDDVLATEDDVEISDPMKTVGLNFRQYFDTNEDEPDICYVRNDWIGVDYEIIREHSEFVDQFGPEE